MPNQRVGAYTRIFLQDVEKKPIWIKAIRPGGDGLRVAKG